MFSDELLNARGASCDIHRVHLQNLIGQSCFYCGRLNYLVVLTLSGNCPTADGTREKGVQEESRTGEREGAREREGEVGHGEDGHGEAASRGRL